jgi:hypothetical protein
MHQQRAIGRHRLGHAGDRLARQRAIERQHPLVGGIVDVAAEFHRDGAVATGQKAGRGERRGHGLELLSNSGFGEQASLFCAKWNSLRAK